MLHSRVVIQDVLGQERLRAKAAGESGWKFSWGNFEKFHFILMPLLLVCHQKTSIFELSVAKAAETFWTFGRR